jgi:hypothetical protein
MYLYVLYRNSVLFICCWLLLLFFGGTNPIGINEYYNDNASLYTKGVSGIPSTGSSISLQQFYGKAKPVTSFSPKLFTYTNGETQTFTVPFTSTYTFVLIGAGGSTATTGGSGNAQQSGSTGGFGGFAIVDIPLIAGETITLGIGGAAGYADSTPANSAGYALRGGTAGSGQGAGGGGTYIYTSSPGTRANYNGYLAGVGGGGGGAFHGFPGNIGGSGIGDASAADGNGYGYANVEGPTPASGSLSGGSATISGKLTGATGANGSNGNTGGAGGGGFGGGSSGAGGGSTAGAGAAGGTITTTFTTSVTAKGGAGGGGHNSNCGGSGGGGGMLLFTSYNPTYFFLSHASIVSIKNGGTHSTLNNIRNFSSFNTVVNSINSLTGVTPDYSLGTPAWIKDSDTYNNARHGAVYIYNQQGLYAFTTHTFTNAGATGRTGPILSQIQSAYSAAFWAQNTTNLNMTTQGIQLWTVPATGSYTITAVGALGGSGRFTGGYGTSMKGTFNLTKGEIIKILVGQKGLDRDANGGTNNNEGGGGGGTFVAKSDNTPMIVAGGGGGSGSSSSGLNASTSTSGVAGKSSYSGTGGINGGGGGGAQSGAAGDGSTPGGTGISCSFGAGGGGFYSRGGYHCNGTVGTQGSSFLEGGIGGVGGAQGNGVEGGFGGGASVGHRSPGGGGYSGGGGDGDDGGGGGGGSYNNGANQTNSVSSNTGHGYVTITAI